MILGAYIAYVVNQAGLNVWIGLVAAVAACSLGSVLLNSGVYTPFQRRGTSPITMVIVSLGMTLIIEFSVAAVAGGTSVSYLTAPGKTFPARPLTPTTLHPIILPL